MNKYHIGAFAWGVGILVLTLTPGKSVPDLELFSYDKIGHAFVFFVFTALLIYGFIQNKESLDFKKYISISIAIALLYGIALEVMQQLIPDRSLEWYDIVANSTGTFLSVVLFYLHNKLFTR